MDDSNRRFELALAQEEIRWRLQSDVRYPEWSAIRSKSAKVSGQPPGSRTQILSRRAFSRCSTALQRERFAVALADEDPHEETTGEGDPNLVLMEMARFSARALYQVRQPVCGAP
jgi:hypothetical protein